MSPTAFQFTPEQTDVLLKSDVVTVPVPAANKKFVIISEDEYDHLRRLLPVHEVDVPFFDCEEIDSPASP